MSFLAEKHKIPFFSSTASQHCTRLNYVVHSSGKNSLLDMKVSSISDVNTGSFI